MAIDLLFILDKNKFLNNLFRKSLGIGITKTFYIIKLLHKETSRMQFKLIFSFQMYTTMVFNKFDKITK